MWRYSCYVIFIPCETPHSVPPPPPCQRTHTQTHARAFHAPAVGVPPPPHVQTSGTCFSEIHRSAII